MPLLYDVVLFNNLSKFTLNKSGGNTVSNQSYALDKECTQYFNGMSIDTY